MVPEVVKENMHFSQQEDLKFTFMRTQIGYPFKYCPNCNTLIFLSTPINTKRKYVSK